MSVAYASGKRSWGFCDRCNFRVRLITLRTEFVQGRANNLLVCRSCWDVDHPQNWQGVYPVFDPQALRNPRPDPSMEASRALTYDCLGVERASVQDSFGTTASFYADVVESAGAQDLGSVGARLVVSVVERGSIQSTIASPSAFGTTVDTAGGSDVVSASVAFAVQAVERASAREVSERFVGWGEGGWSSDSWSGT